MKDFKIAYVNDNSVLNIDSVSNKNFAIKHYAIGLYYLIKELKKNHKVAGSEDAINNIKNGKWNPKEVLIIQEMASNKGLKLIKLGAIPFIWMCFEGPFIGHWFYEKINFYGKNFHTIIIDDKFNKVNFNKNKILSLGYPCIEKKKFKREYKEFTSKDWNSRDLIVGIWANKHYSLHLRKIYYHIINFNIRYILSEIVSKVLSSTYKINLKNQLIDKRISVFLNLSRLCNFHLFGRGWKKTYETPKKVLKKMSKYKNNIFDGDDIKYKFLDKKDILKNYKFSLCFENSSSKNYISEKLYDCFYHKVIPIYLGAPNIHEIIPKESYIDYRDFKSDSELYEYLKDLDYIEANKYLKSAHQFLISSEFKRNTCEYFVESIMDKINSTNL